MNDYEYTGRPSKELQSMIDFKPWRPNQYGVPDTEEIFHNDLRPGDQAYTQGILIDVYSVFAYQDADIKAYQPKNCIIRYEGRLSARQPMKYAEQYRNTGFDCGYGAIGTCKITIVKRS